ncbi:MAG: FixH family protein [Proteobacteria bacterium]|nr:FixH family protein [Pseudomonadota bacterium]HQR03460.1 FixH family protein [Rhodocyclaceae bacterium]
MNKTLKVSQPWYREPWPWLLMAGPFVVVVASLVTAWIAVKTSDGLVTEDYYRQGLAANLTIERSQEAEKLGVVAAVRVTEGRIAVRLSARSAGFTPPQALTLTLSHPTRAGLDQTQTLVRSAEGYVGQFHLPVAGHWILLIEDTAGVWRMMGNLVLPASREILIGGTPAGPPAEP